MRVSESTLWNKIMGLRKDERAIVEALLDRLEQGRKDYGPWNVDDGRNYPKEALAEVIDALHYCAAELVRLAKTHASKGLASKGENQ